MFVINKKKITSKWNSYFAWRTTLDLGFDFFKTDWNKEMKEHKKSIRLVYYNNKKGLKKNTSSLKKRLMCLKL